MRHLTFENTRTLINSISVGKRFLMNIIKHYGQEDNEDIISELEYMVRSIGSIENVDNFYLHNNLRELFDNEKAYSELAKKLNRHLVLYDDFGYCFMYHTRNTIRELDKLTNGFNKPESKMHNYFKLSPKEPDDYSNISDTNTKFDSVMSKMYLSKYNKYVDENDNGAGAWTFQLCTMYLIIVDKLYRLLQPYITDVADFFFRCVVELNPIITGFTYTTEIMSKINALEFIYELAQLTSIGRHLTIKKNEDKSEITFIFTTLNGTFTNNEQQHYSPIFRKDNKGKRKVQVRITGSGKRLFLKVDIIGLQSIQDLTEQACKPSLFSLNTDESYIEVITYKILSTMLSHTQQFQKDLEASNKNARKIVNSGKVESIASEEDIRKFYAEEQLRKNVFKSLQHETLLRPLLYLHKKFPIKKYNVTYYRYVVSALSMGDREISEMLKPIGSKQQAVIRKMINAVKSLNYTGIPALHHLYKAVTYRS